MTVPEDKQQLPLQLAKVMFKLSALFFQRLVLAEDDDLSEVNVKHYDLQCEGAEMLLGFFKNKHQQVQLKAFSLLRQYDPSKVNPIAGAQKHANGTTRRTFLNTTVSGQEYSPIKDINYQSMRLVKEELQGHSQGRSTVREGQSDLQKLLSRVKCINNGISNSREYSYSFHGGHNKSAVYQPDVRENHSYYEGRGYASRVDGNRPILPERIRTMTSHVASYRDIYAGKKTDCQECGSRVMTKRDSRRQFIMDKFGKIEGELSRLGESRGSQMNSKVMGEINNIKQRLRL